MNWNLKQLETFVWVAKLGSFRGTAERLGTTQPNISVRIAELEAALGLRLFDRSSGEISLTSHGRRLLNYAERVLAVAEEFTAQSGSTFQQHSILRLGVTELIAETWLTDFLKQLKKEFPFVTVELTVDFSIHLRPQLSSRALDLTFLNGPITDFDMNNIDIGEVPFVWVTASKFSKRIKSATEMAQFPILTHARSTRSFVEIVTYFRENYSGIIQIVPCTRLASLRQMVIDGLGISAMPEAMVKPQLKTKDLKKLTYSWHPSPLRFTASYAHSPASNLVKRAAELGQLIAKWR